MATRYDDDITFTKTVTMGDSANPGSPVYALNKSASGTASIDLKAAGTLRAQALLDASENFVLKVFASNGSTLQGSLTIAQSNGMATLSNGLTITTGGLTVTAGGATITAGGLSVVAGAVALPLSNYANDAAAAGGGVAIGALYHTSGTVKIRLT